ncbi:hypothetical protein BX600DRAFT_467115 [Xylariales sp. PMI_506]|nr:hypothetical protein BX600DRAFT_467115 [Xylariales sp. PMI_506]
MIPEQRCWSPAVAQALVRGHASGKIVSSDVPLSFLLGVDTKTGIVIDTHHPLHGASLRDRVLVIPCGRGSCSGSGAIIELLLAGRAPAALVFHKHEEILTLGVMIARSMFARSIPVILIEDPTAFDLVARADYVEITEDELLLGSEDNSRITLVSPLGIGRLQLLPEDQEVLEGKGGAAAQMAMEMIVNYAAMQNASSLITVTQVHIDACIYVGESSLTIPERLLSLGAKFVVPTTCNSLSVDALRWRELGADPKLSTKAAKVGDVYLAMGAKMSFTCAPYLLESKPKAGEQIGWAESNAVVFANSILGARTQKYPDYIDVFMALTGRAPNAGCHLPDGRKPTLCIDVDLLENADESLFPLIGYQIGCIAGSRIPLILGLESFHPTISDLKAFGAAFATSSSAAMFHINGVTKEAMLYSSEELQLEVVHVTTSELVASWEELNSARDNSVDLVSLGNPHFSLEEFASLSSLCADRQKQEHVEVMVTTSRETYQKAAQAGYLEAIEQFGAKLITDTCWCMIEEPVIPPHTRNIMTNSAKYAHYGPGMQNRGFHFGSMASCVEAACRGDRSSEDRTPPWLYKTVALN